MFSDPRNVGEVCDCLECQAAGCTAAQLVTVRVPSPQGPRWLHGEPLKVWHAERAAFFERFRKLADTPRITPSARILHFDRPVERLTTPPTGEELPLEPDENELPFED